MALPTSKKHDLMQTVSDLTAQHSIERIAPLGPRQAPDKPIRQHTYDSPANTDKLIANANRSRTLDSHNLQSHAHPSLPTVGSSQKFSSSHITSSPLSVDSMPDSGSPAAIDISSSSLLSHSPLHTAPQPTVRVSSRAINKAGSCKSSGTNRDRDAGMHLDLKRLLSRPAIHTTSSSSAISLPSDSEISASSRHLAHAHKLSGGSHPSSREGATSQGRPVSPHRLDSRDISLSSRNREQEEGSKARNVVRKSSRPATGSSADTPGEPTSRPLARPLPFKHRMRSVEAFHTTATFPRLAASPVSLTTTVARPMPTGLTPAGQVALAYKQQEQRREELAELSGWNDNVRQLTEKSVTPVPSGSRRSLETFPVNREDEEETSGPYYTVFGSSSDHVIAAGSLHDYSQQLDQYFIADDLARKPRRSLSRKMSGRLKKVSEIVKGDREVPTGHARDDSWRPFDGYSHPPKSPRTLVRMSMDDRLDSATHSLNSPRSFVTAKFSARDQDKPIAEESAEERRGLRSVKSMKGKGKEREEEAQGSAKWWKLVKRISTGGLRDKYRVRTASPPPVPPLPLDLQKPAESRMTFDIRASPRQSLPGDGHPHSTSLRGSISGARPATGSSQKTTHLHTLASRPSTGGKASSSPSVPRQSTTTRSSSPISSDFASSGYFRRTHSTHSSRSSYGEEIPPVPSTITLKSKIGQYILPPSELSRLDTDNTKQPVVTRRKPTRSQSEPVDHRRCPSSAEEALPSLPLPPRRSVTDRPEQGSCLRSPSPSLPSFSTEGAVNSFSSPSLSLPEFGGTPPRPRRSSRRKPASIELPPRATTLSTLPRTPRTPRPHAKVSVDVDLPSRPSTSASSYHPSTKQASLSHSSLSISPSSTLSSQNRSPLTFRDVESPRQAWTEKEKADKWEALLERSARAGGTLHIGETGLLSENMRLSQCSET